MKNPWRTWHRMQALMAVLCVSGVLLGGTALAQTAEGPSAEETLKVIRETMLSCGVVRSHTYRVNDPDARVPYGQYQEFLIKRVDVSNPWTFKVRERNRALSYFQYKKDLKKTMPYMGKGYETVEVFALAQMSPEVRVESMGPSQSGEKLGVSAIRLSCAQGGCVRTSKRSLRATITTCTGRYAIIDGCGGFAAGGVPIQQSEIENIPPSETMQASVILPTCNEQTAQSLAKIFQHAITLAGGKKPLF